MSNAPQQLSKLAALESYGGARLTHGLPADVVAAFLETDPRLGVAIDRAYDGHRALRAEHELLLKMPEAELCRTLQRDYLNFYEPAAVNGYVPLAGDGPWLVTSHGAVLHDSAGYGMLGHGHAPAATLAPLAQPLPMANVMTPSLSQLRFTERLKSEIGHARGGCPFAKFLCLNSGSEAVSIAARISDLNAGAQTAPGAAHAGATIKYLSLSGSFHGRTARAARLSHSCQAIYEQHLASFRDRQALWVVAPDDLDGLERTFAEAAANDVFLEAFFIEPVLGEGVPGRAISREFYDLARELTTAAGTLLVVDSIQAGLRATGALSIVDYPGFEDCAPPDMEAYSKALNAGQYPLSVLALTASAAGLYVPGVYGNTMTTNPRALEVGCAVLDAIDDDLRRNIRARGAELVVGLEALALELPGAIRSVEGTGLLVCAELDPDHYTVCGFGGVEQYLRAHGIAMIHGGKNGLRFTPHFGITSAEVQLIVETVRQALIALAGARPVAAASG